MTETSKARLTLTLSEEEYDRLRKHSLNSELLNIANLSTLEPNTIILEGESQNGLLHASRIVKALTLGFSSEYALQTRLQ